MVSVCEKFKITDNITLNVEVTDAIWLEDEKLWYVTARHLRQGMGDLGAKERLEEIESGGLDSVVIRTEVFKCKILVSGVGSLVEAAPFPDQAIPGRETFKGPIIHSARWDNTVNFKDRDVIVVGGKCLTPFLMRTAHN